MEQLKKHYITAKTFKGTLVFKYHLNGVLAAFELVDAELSEKQIKWLFSHRFPYLETQINHFNALENFNVSSSEIDLGFEAFWNAYTYKIGKRVMAQNAWNKLSKSDRIAALKGIRPYNNYLKRNIGVAKAHASTYLNQKYWTNEYASM